MAVPGPALPLPPSFDPEPGYDRYRALEAPTGWMAQCVVLFFVGQLFLSCCQDQEPKKICVCTFGVCSCLWRQCRRCLFLHHRHGKSARLRVQQLSGAVMHSDCYCWQSRVTAQGSPALTPRP